MQQSVISETGCDVQEEAGLGVPGCSSRQGPLLCTKAGFPAGCCTRMQAGMASADSSAGGETAPANRDELKKISKLLLSLGE